MAEIGIVTVSHNQARYLECAMQSVLRSGVDVEYVVVDPGSTDGSREIINRYRHALADVVFEDDAGPADGLNKGMARLTAPVIGYLNADDFYLDGALSEAAALFAQQPAWDIALGHGVVVDEAGQRLRRLRATPFTARRFARGATQLVQQATFFRAAAFERTSGFNPENQTCWDLELLLDMVAAGARTTVVNRYWGAFRYYSGSISGTGRLRREYERDHERLVAKALGRTPTRYDRAIARLGRPRKWVRDPTTGVMRVADWLSVGSRR